MSSSDHHTDAERFKVYISTAFCTFLLAPLSGQEKPEYLSTAQNRSRVCLNEDEKLGKPPDPSINIDCML